MSKIKSFDEWMRGGHYLPKFMRDFHDQKRLFKRIEEIVFENRKSGATLRRDLPNWIVAHVYVIDYFLWFMARRGWTLQRSRAAQPFIDLSTDLTEFDRRQMEQFKREIATSAASQKGLG